MYAQPNVFILAKGQSGCEPFTLSVTRLDKAMQCMETLTHFISNFGHFSPGTKAGDPKKMHHGVISHAVWHRLCTSTTQKQCEQTPCFESVSRYDFSKVPITIGPSPAPCSHQSLSSFQRSEEQSVLMATHVVAWWKNMYPSPRKHDVLKGSVWFM